MLEQNNSYWDGRQQRKLGGLHRPVKCQLFSNCLYYAGAFHNKLIMQLEELRTIFFEVMFIFFVCRAQ